MSQLTRAPLLQLAAMTVLAVATIIGTRADDSKCAEFEPITVNVEQTEEEWVAVMETVPKGHTDKFCLIYDVKLINVTTATVHASKDGVITDFLLTVPKGTSSISTFDLHLDALPDPPPLQTTFKLAHYKHNHYYCFVQCSMNYDLYDDYVACFTTQRKMSDEDKADVDKFVDGLGFRLNDKNATIHIDTSEC